MSGHTPGPWKYFYDTEEVVAASGAIGRFEPASGHLVAAAPDMLAAIEAFFETRVVLPGNASIESWLERHDAAVDRLDEAARKARGGL